MVIGIDDYLAKVPGPWARYLDHVGARADDGIGFERVGDHVSLRCGPAGRRVLAAYRAAVSAVARSGINVIVDEVLLEDDGWQKWERQLEGLDVTWVSVDCEPALREERERQRGDRMIGISRAVAAIVHRKVVYDAAVDTSAADPVACAEAIVGRLDRRRLSGGGDGRTTSATGPPR